jgi:hypothetical protein
MEISSTIHDGIERILAQPVVQHDDVELLCAWLLEMLRINEALAQERKEMLDVTVRLRERVEWYQQMTMIRVK